MLNSQIELAPREYIPRIEALELRCEALASLCRVGHTQHEAERQRVLSALKRAYRDHRLVFTWSA